MSDPIAEAAAQMSDAAPSSSEPVAGSGVFVNGVELPTPAVIGNTITLADAPPTGNVMVNDTRLVDAPAIETKQYSDGSTATGVAPLPDVSPVEPSRDSLLMRMHAAIDELEAKIATGVHVFAHEVAALRDHIKKVL